DVGVVVEAAVDAVTPGALAKSVTLERRIDAAAGPVWGDSHRLQQVVWNLLSNAIKFTGSGGRVGVTVDREDPHVVVRVADTGQGIAPEFLPFIFDRFRQADSTTTRAHGGLGLGLAIVHYLVTLHRGTVTAESDGPDRGATFTVRVPLAPLRPTARAAAQAATGVDRLTPLAGIRVLVVDDDADTRDLITAVLGQSGADVLTAASAQEALDMLARARPHVLASDLSMRRADVPDELDQGLRQFFFRPALPQRHAEMDGQLRLAARRRVGDHADEGARLEVEAGPRPQHPEDRLRRHVDELAHDGIGIDGL